MSTDTKFQLERVRAPVSDAELISDMRRVAELAGTSAVSFRLYSKLGRYHPSTVALRFGTWNEALVAADLAVTTERDIADERLFENLMRLWEHYGRQPRFRELARPPSVISSGPYQRRFGSWMNALERFVAYANAQDARPPTPPEVTTGHRTGRDPSLRLRFRVMKRDNFSCRACGASPALQPGLTLHVDHIKAWSLGGETVEENLQTLCEPCNLGKSNVLQAPRQRSSEGYGVDVVLIIVGRGPPAPSERNWKPKFSAVAATLGSCESNVDVSTNCGSQPPITREQSCI